MLWIQTAGKGAEKNRTLAGKGEREKMMLEKKLQEAFRWFHAHPELSYQEYETTRKIRQWLEEEGIEILPCPLETGLAAVIRGGKPGPVRALRCDIDALPVREETGLEWGSVYEGKMHACGHDFHIVTGLGAAALLNSRRDRLRGTVKIIFQPAEESSLGALKILETDAAADVEYIWGLHADPTNETGTLGIREGWVSAAVDRFVITVEGSGCHGAHPDDGIDPIPPACAIVAALQTIVTRNMNAFRPALVSVTRIQAGNTWNVVPSQAQLEGTVRTMDRQDREQFEKRLKKIAADTASAYGAAARTEWIPGPPAVYNDASMVRAAMETARSFGLHVAEEEQSMGGDDFSFYEEKIPGCYIKVGTGTGPAIHQPGFRVNPEIIGPAAEYAAGLLELVL